MALVPSVLAVALSTAAAQEVERDPPPAAPPEDPTTYKKLSLAELMEVDVIVTSVSRRPEKLSGTASAIQVVTQEDIRRSGATRLPEALRQVSNLQIAQVDSRQWAISARGFNATSANKMLVMIDGRTIYTPLFAGVFWDKQDTFLPDVERIEVVSGPGATLWGANAVNGVISVVTKSARDTQGLYVEGGGGTELRAMGGARYGDRLAEDVHYRVYAKQLFRDDAATPAGDDRSDQMQMGQGGMRIDWDASPTSLVTLQGDIYHGDVEQPTLDDVTFRGGNVLGRWTQRLAEESSLSLQSYYDRTDRRIPGSISSQVDTWDVDFQHHFPLGTRNDLVWGLGYRIFVDDIENAPTIALYPESVSRELFTGFIQDEIELSQDELYLTLGTKVGHNDYSGYEVQPSARIAYRPARRHTIWAAVSRAVRSPSRVDRELFIPATPPYTIAGGEGFDSEKMWAYELGYRVQPVDWLSLSLSLFYNDYDDLRSREQVAPPAPTPTVLANGLHGYSYGAEFAGDARLLEWLRLRCGYTELRIDLRPDSDSTDTSDGSGESHDSEHTVYVRPSLELPWRMELDCTFRYISEIANQDVPAYAELEARLGWMARRDLELSVVGQNLLHDRHSEFGVPATRAEIERGVYGKVVWRF
ncbi:MAG: TonB-dependent receptor [Planctomycetes bacterium]|nr:TonB-dependent receptor [Planctomycetota bacterium]